MRISDWSSDVCSSDLVERLRPGQQVVADLGEGGAAAGVLHAGPGQHGVEIVGAVHEDGAGLNLAADCLGRGQIRCPDRGGEAVGRIVHQAHRLLVRSEEHTSELQSLMRISYAVFCLKKKNTKHHTSI